MEHMTDRDPGDPYFDDRPFGIKVYMDFVCYEDHDIQFTCVSNIPPVVFTTLLEASMREYERLIIRWEANKKQPIKKAPSPKRKKRCSVM